jgi:hypothetical protein
VPAHSGVRVRLSRTRFGRARRLLPSILTSIQTSIQTRRTATTLRQDDAERSGDHQQGEQKSYSSSHLRLLSDRTKKALDKTTSSADPFFIGGKTNAFFDAPPVWPVVSRGRVVQNTGIVRPTVVLSLRFNLSSR